MDTVIIMADYLSHSKVLHFIDADGGQIRNNFSSAQIAGTVEIWVNNPGAQDWYIILRDESGDTCCSIRYTSKTNIRIYSGDGVGGNNETNTTVVGDAWVHLRIEFDCATDTYSVWIDGVSKITDQNFNTDQTATTLDWLQIYSADASEGYIDAVGYSWDTSYNIGDNYHWRSYMMLDDDFEADDLDTADTSITWVDAVSHATFATIVGEFNAHKKVLREYTANQAQHVSHHDFDSAATAGWVELCIKTDDVTMIAGFYLSDDPDICIDFRISASQFQVFTAAAWRQVTGSPTPVNSTWYYIFLQWYADNTFDLWIDNVQYEDGTANEANQTDGIDKISISAVGDVTPTAVNCYIDAVGSSLDSETYLRSDNRTFSYNAYSYTDITSNIVSCSSTHSKYDWSILFLETDGSITLDTTTFIQIYDENSDLRFEGEYQDEVLVGLAYRYEYHSFNKGELDDQVSYAATAAEDINASFLAILTNVAQENTKRLIYHTEDDPAATITPNFRNKICKDIMRWQSIHGNVSMVVKANGVCFLDANAVPINGAYTITQASGEIVGSPTIQTIDTQTNRVVVYGGQDPDTGTPFSGTAEDTTKQIHGINKFFRRYWELQSDADCAARADKILNGTGFQPQRINVPLDSVYANPNEIINFAYPYKSFSATDCYVESVSYNWVQGVGDFILNTGIFDLVGLLQPEFPLAGQTADDIAEMLYNTDIITIYPEMFPDSGAAKSASSGTVTLDNQNEELVFHFFIDDKIDPSRDMILSFSQMVDGGANYNVSKYLKRIPCDNTTAVWTVEWDYVGTTFKSGVVNRFEHDHLTIASSDVVADNTYVCRIRLDDDARTIVFTDVSVRYYVRRSV